MAIIKTCFFSVHIIFLSLILAYSNAFAADLLIVDSLTAEPYTSVRLAVLEELKSQGFSQGTNLTIKRWSVGNADGMTKRAWLEEKDKHYDLSLIHI